MDLKRRYKEEPKISEQLDNDDPRDKGPRDCGEGDEALLRLFCGLGRRPRLLSQWLSARSKGYYIGAGACTADTCATPKRQKTTN